MRLAVIFWLCPALYLILNLLDQYCGWWGGDLFVGTPFLHSAGKIIFPVWVAGIIIHALICLNCQRKIAFFRKSVFPCSNSMQNIFRETLQHQKITKEVGVGQTNLTEIPPEQITGGEFQIESFYGLWGNYSEKKITYFLSLQ